VVPGTFPDQAAKRRLVCEPMNKSAPESVYDNDIGG